MITREASSPNRYACGATEPTGNVTCAPTGFSASAMQHSASATASPPSLVSCAEAHLPAPHQLADHRLQRLLSRRVQRRRAARDLSRGHQEPLGAAELPLVSPSTAISCPAVRNTPAQVALTSGSSPTIGDGRRGEDRLALGLVVEADVAAHDRDVRARGRPSAMPRVASANCHMISGRSGLPKFRQSVRPSGSPPTQETFRAHSATASRAPSNGSRYTKPRVAVDGQREALSGPLDTHHRRVAGPGRSTAPQPHDVVVLPDRPTPCCAMVGRGEQREQRLAVIPRRRDRRRIERTAARPARRAAASAGRRPARHRSAASTGRFATSFPSSRIRDPPVVGDSPDDRRVEVPLLEDAKHLVFAAPLGHDAACAPGSRRA